jgi:hypothetical protein
MDWNEWLTQADRWLDRWSSRVIIALALAGLFMMLSLCLLWN